MTAGRSEPCAPQDAPHPRAGALSAWLPAAALAGVCAIYLATLSTLPPSVFWSPDEGAKFLQMYGGMADAGAPHRPAYRAAVADPFYTFYPAASIYPQPLWPAGVRSHWPPLFPVLSSFFFKTLGVWGLYAIPMGGGILAAAGAGALARRHVPAAVAPAMVLAGVATPLLFHAVLVLEHTLTCTLGLGALLCGQRLLDGGPIRRRLGWGLAALVGVLGMLAMRDETVIFLGALACAGALLAGSKRVKWLLAGGAGAIAAALAFFPDCPADTAGRAAALAADAGRALRGLADPGLWRGLPHHVLWVLVADPSQFGAPLTTEWAAVGLAGLGLCGVAAIVVPRRRLACWMAGACLVGLISALGLGHPERYRAVHGFLLPMPCLVLAWLPTPSAGCSRTRAERFLCALLPLYLALYTFATWLLRRPTGGPEWGLRYPLIAYLLAAVLGAMACARFARANRGARRVAGLTAAAMLCAISVGYTLRGVFEIQVTKRDLLAFEREMVVTDRPVVTDHWWMAAALAPTFVRTEFYTLPARGDFSLWFERIGRRTPAFLYVSYDPPPPLARTPTAPAAALVQRRKIQEMMFSTFQVQAPP
jgi:hypothetical protein